MDVLWESRKSPMGKCEETGCEEQASCAGFCKIHYYHYKKAVSRIKEREEMAAGHREIIFGDYPDEII